MFLYFYTRNGQNSLYVLTFVQLICLGARGNRVTAKKEIPQHRASGIALKKCKLKKNHVDPRKNIFLII